MAVWSQITLFNLRNGFEVNNLTGHFLEVIERHCEVETGREQRLAAFVGSECDEFEAAKTCLKDIVVLQLKVDVPILIQIHISHVLLDFLPQCNKSLFGRFWLGLAASENRFKKVVVCLQELNQRFLRSLIELALRLLLVLQLLSCLFTLSLPRSSHLFFEDPFPLFVFVFLFLPSLFLG